MAAARAADPDPDRNSLRAALLIEDEAARQAKLRPLAARADPRAWSPASLILLGHALAVSGDPEAGVDVLRRASWAHPEDARTHYFLGMRLQQARPPQPEEAIRALALAWARQPELAGARLALALDDRGRGAEAEAVWRGLVTRRPDYAEYLGMLGLHLKARGRAAEADTFRARALASVREEIRQKPDSALAHLRLGVALTESRDLPGAIASLREAIRLKPDMASAHLQLGSALAESGDLPGAIASAREAIRLKPDFAEAHTKLGTVLADSGDVPAAITSAREAIRLKPDFAAAYTGLGSILCDVVGDYAAAADAFREAIRLKPDYAMAHNNLGVALTSSGDLPGGIAAQREAIRLRPDYAIAHNNLAYGLMEAGDLAGALASAREVLKIDPALPEGLGTVAEVLVTRGRFDDAVAALEKAAARMEQTKLPKWSGFAAGYRRILPPVRRLAATGAEIDALAVAAGRDRDKLEAVDLAALAAGAGKPGLAARVYEVAFAALPSRARGRRSHAARAALRAASTDAGEAAAFRRLAFGWLRSELAAHQAALKAGDAAARAAIAKALQGWKQDNDLAAVRDPDALARLAEPERAAWKGLWDEVDRLLAASNRASATTRSSG